MQKAICFGEQVGFLRHAIRVIAGIGNISDSYWKSEAEFKMRASYLVYGSTCLMEINLLCLLQSWRQFDVLTVILLPEKNLNLGFDRLFSKAKLGCEWGNGSSLQIGSSWQWTSGSHLGTPGFMLSQGCLCTSSVNIKALVEMLSCQCLDEPEFLREEIRVTTPAFCKGFQYN